MDELENTQGQLSDQSQTATVLGAFHESLVRTNRQIKADRAAAISEDVETVYRRKVEDLGLKIRRMKQTQSASLDFSPETAGTLKLQQIDAESFSDSDLKACRDIRDLEITYELAKVRYHYLFGKTINI